MRLFLVNFLLFTLSFTSTYTIAVANPYLFVVETDWLSTRLDQTDLTIIDVRSFEAYQQSHIKNAINLPVDDTFGKGINDNLLASIQSLKTFLIGRA